MEKSGGIIFLSNELLAALQLSDSTFPSGGFAFSQGLEAAHRRSDEIGRFDLEGFIENQIRHRWALGDRVALVRAYRLSTSLKELEALDREIEASLAIEPLRKGSQRNGGALLLTFERMGNERAGQYRTRIRSGTAIGHLPIAQALVWYDQNLSEQTVVAISGYQCISNITAAAVRMGLVGAIDVQRIIKRLLPIITVESRREVAVGELISSFVPLSEIALCLPNKSGQKLFSN